MQFWQRDQKCASEKSKTSSKQFWVSWSLVWRRIKPRPSLIPCTWTQHRPAKDLSKRSQILQLSETNMDKMLQGLESLLSCWEPWVFFQSPGTQFPAPTWWIKLSGMLVLKALVPSSGRPRHGTHVDTCISEAKILICMNFLKYKFENNKSTTTAQEARPRIDK